MNSRHRLYGAWFAALGSLALGTALAAAPDAPPPDKPGMMHHDDGTAGMRMHMGMGMGMGMHGAEPGMAFMRALHGLDLNEEQRSKVHALMDKAHEKWDAQRKGVDESMAALGNPGAAGYSAAVAAAKAHAADHIQQWSDLQQQIYGLLTPAQQAKLPEQLQKMHEHMMGGHDHEMEHDKDQ